MSEPLPEISIIVPCYNEEDNLAALFGNIERILGDALSAEIILVDDNSTDGTYEAARNLESHHRKVRAVHKDSPRGLGNAVRHGISLARGRMGIVVMADGVDPLETLPALRDRIIAGGCDLALLSRYDVKEDYADIPFSYRFHHWGFHLLSRILVGVEFKDITYAYRAFDLAFIRSLGLTSGGFEISPEITFKAFLAGGKIAEVRGRQARRVRGRSKFLFRKAGYGYTRVLLEASFERFRKIWR